MIDFVVDALVPCLKETETGDIYETEVIRVKRKSILSKYNKQTGWAVNWSKFPSDVEIYALVLKGTNSIQGLVAVEYNDEAKAVHIVWACTAPDNNIWKYGKQKFQGVGGHLFAIASDLSEKHGYDGFVYGEAIDSKLLEYYCNTMHAQPIPSTNGQYAFMLSDVATRKLREVYSYDWTDDII